MPAGERGEPTIERWRDVHSRDAFPPHRTEGSRRDPTWSLHSPTPDRLRVHPMARNRPQTLDPAPAPPDQRPPPRSNARPVTGGCEARYMLAVTSPCTRLITRRNSTSVALRRGLHGMTGRPPQSRTPTEPPTGPGPTRRNRWSQTRPVHRKVRQNCATTSGETVGSVIAIEAHAKERR
jgi:hypothetical protein